MFDLRYGVVTEKFYQAKALGLPEGGIAYHPSDWLSLRRAVRQLQLGPDDVFIDYGCGLGRTLITAGRSPCRGVIGLEYSPRLAQRARENLVAARRHLRCAESEVVECDAAAYEPPDNLTVAYFYNPFDPPLLEAVLNALQRSLRRAPRTIRILYRHPHHFEALAASRPWLQKVAEYADFGPHRYVIYHATKHEGALPPADAASSTSMPPSNLPQ